MGASPFWANRAGGTWISSNSLVLLQLNPACATLPLPGISAEVIEKDGTPTPVGEKGFLCITKPWPSMIRPIWNDPERFVKSYFGDCKKDGKPSILHGDGVVVDELGYIIINGRIR